MSLGQLFRQMFLDLYGYSWKAPEPTKKELRPFNMIISKQESFITPNGPIGVVIKDWTRSIGVNSVIKAEHDAEEAGLNDVILVGNRFSLQAKGMAQRMGIRLISKGELVVTYQEQQPAIF